jgi:hypothetical protein
VSNRRRCRPGPRQIHLADQLHAAGDEAHRILLRWAEAGEGQHVLTLAPSEWLRDQMERLVGDIVARRERFCPHVGANPQVLYAAAWRACWLTCLLCSLAADRAITGTPADRRSVRLRG